MNILFVFQDKYGTPMRLAIVRAKCIVLRSYDLFYRSHANVRGPKVVIALRSSVFFWPRYFLSTSLKLLKGGII